MEGLQFLSPEVLFTSTASPLPFSSPELPPLQTGFEQMDDLGVPLFLETPIWKDSPICPYRSLPTTVFNTNSPSQLSCLLLPDCRGYPHVRGADAA